MRLLVSGHEVNSRIFFCRCKVKTNKRNYAMRWLRRSGFDWKHWSGLQSKDNVTLVKRHEKENRTKDAGKTTSSQCSSFPYDVSSWTKALAKQNGRCRKRLLQVSVRPSLMTCLCCPMISDRKNSFFASRRRWITWPKVRHKMIR